MMNYGQKVSLTNAGFEELEPWTKYKHENGLIVTVDEHEWQIEEESGTWAEGGSLNDIGILWRIIDDYAKRRSD